MNPITNSLFENVIVDQTFDLQLDTSRTGLTAVNYDNSQQNLHLLSILAFLEDNTAKVLPEPIQITTPNLAERFDFGSNWNTNQQVANILPELTQNALLSPDYQQYLNLLMLSTIQPAPFPSLDTLKKLRGYQYQQPLLTQIYPQVNSQVFVPQQHKNSENIQINRELNRVSKTVTGEQYNSRLENQTILSDPNQNPDLWSLNDMALLTQNQYQKQDLTNSKPDTSAIRHRVSNKRKDIRKPDKFHIPDQYDAVLGIDIVKNGIIQCQNLLKKVKYEQHKLNISKKTCAERVLGKTVAALDGIFESDRRWEELSIIGKKNYWNLFQWVNASDSDKNSIIRGDQPSVPVFQQYTPFFCRTLTPEQCQNLEEKYRGKPLPKFDEREEIAREWNVDGKVVHNYVANMRIKRRKNNELC